MNIVAKEGLDTLNKLHLIMPMAGGGTRFSEKGFTVPKPLIKIQGKPFFYWAVQSIITPPPIIAENVIDITFVVLHKHVDENQIDKEIYKFFPNAKIKIIPEVLPGAVCTCLKGVEDITDDNPVIFNDCDHMFSCNALAKRLAQNNQLDFEGALVTFESNIPHFSYVKYDEAGNIIGTVEKQVVSNHAICGAYFFANAEIFRTMSEKYFETCQYKEYFISGVYNELCKANKKIVDFTTDFYLSFGTPEEYESAKNSNYFDLIKSFSRG